MGIAFTLPYMLISGTLVEGIVSPVSRDSDDVVSFYFGLLQVNYFINSCVEMHVFTDYLDRLHLKSKNSWYCSYALTLSKCLRRMLHFLMLEVTKFN